MFNIFNVIGKNFRILARSKFSALAIIAIPLLIVLMTGMAFDTSSLEGIRASVYTNESSNLTESIISELQEEGFEVLESNSKEDCIESVRIAKSHVCIVFPRDFLKESLEVHADDSRMDMAHFLINEIGSQVLEKSSEIGIERTGALLGTIVEIKDTLTIQEEKISEVRNTLNNILEEESYSLQEISSQLDSISSEVGDLDDIKDDIDNIDTNDSISDIKRDIDSIKSNVDSLLLETEGDIKDLEGEIKEINQDLGNVNSKLRDSIKKLEQYSEMDPLELTSPIRTEINPLMADATNWEYLFPTFLSLIILLGSLILGSIIVMRERKSNAYFRNFITPTTNLTFFMGVYLTCLALLSIQIAIVIFSLNFVNNVVLTGKIARLLLTIFLSGTTFIFVGMLIGYLFNSDETIVLTSISVAAISIFFSNIVLPIESISGLFKNISIYNPLVLTNEILRRVILFNTPITNLFFELGILGAFVISFGLLAFCLALITKRKAGFN